MSHPASAQATSLVLSVAMHFRTRGFSFVEAVERAEELLAPFWNLKISQSADDELWAVLHRLFD